MTWVLLENAIRTTGLTLNLGRQFAEHLSELRRGV
jgi:hypothetical protein